MDDIALILPVYNERDTLTQVLDEWTGALRRLGLRYRFVICEDGSTDGTKELLTELRQRYPITVSQRNTRRGYGKAVRDGIEAAQARYVLCIDSDGQCDPTDLDAFWRSRDRAQVIIGWRVKRADTPQRKVFSLLFKSAFRLMFPTHIHDPSAPFVLFAPETVIPHMRYLVYLKEGFWWGFVGMCVKKGLTIHELPVHHRLRMQGDTQVYHLNKIPGIAVRNVWGLLRLRLAP